MTAASPRRADHEPLRTRADAVAGELVAGPRLAEELRRCVMGDAGGGAPPAASADSPELHASAA